MTEDQFNFSLDTDGAFAAAPAASDVTEAGPIGKTAAAVAPAAATAAAATAGCQQRQRQHPCPKNMFFRHGIKVLLFFVILILNVSVEEGVTNVGVEDGVTRPIEWHGSLAGTAAGRWRRRRRR